MINNENKEKFIAKFKIDERGVEDLNKLIKDARNQAEKDYVKNHNLQNIEKGLQPGDIINYSYSDGSGDVGIISSVSASKKAYTMLRAYGGFETIPLDHTEYRSVVLSVARTDPQWKVTLGSALQGMYNSYASEKNEITRDALKNVGVPIDLLDKYIPVGERESTLIRETKDKEITRLNKDISIYKEIVGIVGPALQNLVNYAEKRFKKREEEKSSSN